MSRQEKLLEILQSLGNGASEEIAAQRADIRKTLFNMLTGVTPAQQEKEDEAAKQRDAAVNVPKEITVDTSRGGIRIVNAEDVKGAFRKE